jgi:hypothetical protein
MYVKKKIKNIHFKLKKAYMLNNEKVNSIIIKIIDNEDIIYKVGQCEHRGTIEYNCF